MHNQVGKYFLQITIIYIQVICIKSIFTYIAYLVNIHKNGKNVYICKQ